MADCMVSDCDTAAKTRGWCTRHYKRWHRYGNPTAGGALRIADPIERLHSRINKTDTCWLYTGQVNNKGYGVFAVGNTKRGAHVVVYELLVGPVPDGLELDHRCRVTLCVNPDHLESVTHAENQRRMGLAQTHCRRAGHPYTPDNTYRSPRGERRCRKCARNRDGERAPRRKRAA